MDAQEDGALTTITNPAYGMVKQGGGKGGGGGGGQHEIVDKSPGTDPLTTTTAKKMPFPPFHQPLFNTSLFVAPDEGVVRKAVEEGVYETFPEDQ